MAADPRKVRDALRAMEAHLQGLVSPAEQQLHHNRRVVQEMSAALDQADADLSDYLARVERALRDCQEARRDNKKIDCSQLQRQQREIEGAIKELGRLQGEFSQVVSRYQSSANKMSEVIQRDIPQATHWLRDRERALEKFDSGRGVGVNLRAPAKAGQPSQGASSRTDQLLAFGRATIASGDPALLSAFNAQFEGMGGHGSQYQKARQTFLRSLADNPNQPRHVRGWIKQELNRIDAAKRARAAGLQPPGRASSSIKGIPGLDVGHRFPDLDLPENFRLEDAWVNRRRYHVAKRLGVENIFR